MSTPTLTVPHGALESMHFQLCTDVRRLFMAHARHEIGADDLSDRLSPLLSDYVVQVITLAFEMKPEAHPK